MGQYYYPTFYKQKGNKFYGSQFYAHEYGGEYGQGLKLTEHGYVGNSFVESVLTQLFNNPQRVYWCGDYFEKKDFEDVRDYYRMRRTWKKYRLENNKSNYCHPEEINSFSEDKFIVNHTKHCFINMKKWCREHEDAEWQLHPLCILTAVGNGRGGGDYYGVDEEDVGIWAGDLIEIKANEFVVPEGYTDCTDDVWFEETY